MFTISLKTILICMGDGCLEGLPYTRQVLLRFVLCVAAVLNSKEQEVRQSAVEVYRYLARTIRDGDVLQQLAKGLVDLVSGMDRLLAQQRLFI